MSPLGQIINRSLKIINVYNNTFDVATVSKFWSQIFDFQL